MKIFSRFAVEYNVQGDFRDVAMVDPPHGFPHCVELFCKNAFLRQSGIKAFFRNPVECVRHEIRNFIQYDPYKFVVLLLLLLNNNQLDGYFFENLVDSPTQEQEQILTIAGISSKKSSPMIFKALNSLKIIYLKQNPDGAYCFTHESLIENVALEFISLRPYRAFQLIDFKYILTFTNLPDQAEAVIVNSSSSQMFIYQ